MRFWILAALLLFLTACAPAAVPTFEREDEQVTITVQANENLFDVNLSVVNASTDDERCITLADMDLACRIGLIPQGEAVTVEVISPGSLSCIVFAYLQPGALTSYRPFPCRIN